MANIKEAFEYAAKNPNSDFAKNLEKLASSGSLDVEAKKYGIDLAPFKPKELEKKPITQKIADFTGGKEIAQGLGQALANPRIAKQQEQIQQEQTDIQGQLIARIRENKAQGKDTSRLEQALGLLGQEISRTGQETGQLLNQEGLTTKQVLGDALQLGGTIAGLGTVGTVTKPTGLMQGIIDGAVTGAKSGATFGGISGVAQGLQEDKTLGQSLAKGLGGATLGGISGGILGGILGGATGRVTGSKLRKQVLDAQINSGEKSAQSLFGATPEVRQKAIQIAKEQGFAEPDIDFLNSMSRKDRSVALKMINLADKASKDKRVIERPIDIVGDNMIKRVKFIQGINSNAGKEVNAVAKTLRGQAVDANPIAQQAQSLIDDLGVRTTPTGQLDFSNSVFKNTPTLQKKLQKFITEVPSGQADAYDVHIFKKSIDELVDYGTQGEGLKGNSERILKALRATADDALDSTFPEYNTANSNFRATKEVLDEVNSLFGKKVGVGKERGGQLLRSVFSNNTQRPRVLQLVEALDNTSKSFGKTFDDNLIDQALFTEILEDVYGTQATTSLQGQVARAVRGTQRFMEGIRNPVQGVGDVLASGTERIMGISDENKKKVLTSLLRQI
jgi:hypothetical protein